MSRSLFLGLAAMAFLTLGRAAVAEDPPKPLDFSNPEELFKQLDKNHDGQLTPDEIPAEHRRLFERLLRIADKNGDGKLSLEEFVAGVKEGAGGHPPGAPPGQPGEGRPGGGENRPNLDQAFERLDQNKDGKVTADEIPEQRRENFKKALERLGKKPDDGLTKEEFARVMGEIMARRPEAGPPDANRPPEANRSPEGRRPPEGGPPGDLLFRLLDKNGDGIITDDEISAAAEALHKFAKEHDGKITREAVGLPPMPPPGSTAGREPNPAPGQGPGRANSGEFLMRRFKAMDKNGDGKVSKDEAEGMLKERFDEIDTNHDGFIDEAEMKQVIEKIGERFRQDGGQPPARPGVRPAGPPEKPAPPESK